MSSILREDILKKKALIRERKAQIKRIEEMIENQSRYKQTKSIESVISMCNAEIDRLNRELAVIQNELRK